VAGKVRWRERLSGCNHALFGGSKLTRAPVWAGADDGVMEWSCGAELEGALGRGVGCDVEEEKRVARVFAPTLDETEERHSAG
jgi:hypothetical protein